MQNILIWIYIWSWDYLETLQIQSQSLLVDQIAIFIIAIVIDLIVGDPSEKLDRFYPIVWISRLIYFFDQRTSRGNARREQALGVLYPLLILAIFVLPCLLLFLAPGDLIYIVAGALVFKMTFTIKGLERFGRNAMVAPDLEAKRAAVGKIVSRDVKALDRAHLDSAAIESVAENLTDSVIAPFFYFMLFGISGAMAYRVINTLDAVVGYKTGEYLHFGWFSAKTDDLLNYIPERIAAGLIMLTSRSNWRAFRALKLKVGVHLTIAAMSLALRVKLEKVGHYAVGEQFEPASGEDIERAIRVMKLSAVLFVFMCLGVLLLLYLCSLSRFTIFTAASTALLA
jgi:adenosylcobinamide-phosphate synthase